MQDSFVADLKDVIKKGVGRLVDADMNEESTRLKALQTQQQLGIQALSIANSDSQNVCRSSVNREKADRRGQAARIIARSKKAASPLGRGFFVSTNLFYPTSVFINLDGVSCRHRNDGGLTKRINALAA